MEVPKGVKVSEVSVTLAQASDVCEIDVGQELEIKTQDAGGGNFIIISTRRWAIDADEIDTFAKMLKSVLNG